MPAIIEAQLRAGDWWFKEADEDGDGRVEVYGSGNSTTVDGKSHDSVDVSDGDEETLEEESEWSETK